MNKSGQKKDNTKEQNENEVNEFNPEPPKEKEKNIERFIHLTKYDDIDFMQKIKKFFEEINQKAFNLRSSKEIYTLEMKPEDLDNNEIDYISGFQIIDKDIRLTIIEGITGKAIKLIKDGIPKNQMNDKKNLYFSNMNILFNERIYSKFGLSLKFIKLRDTLSNILQTFDIYVKAKNYKKIYDAFMCLGSILRAKTIEEISIMNDFPEADSLLLLERKYGDILKEEDLTGKKIEKKKKNLLNIKLEDNFAKDHFNKIKGVIAHSINKNELKKNLTLLSNEVNNKYINPKINTDINPNINGIINKLKYKKIKIKPINTKLRPGLSVDTKEENQHSFKKYNLKIVDIKPRISSFNAKFVESLKKRDESSQSNSSDYYQKNFDYIKNMERKKRVTKLWKPFIGEYDKSKPINFYAIRNNHYEELVNKLREKYSKDRNNFYTYSKYALTLSFPMVDKFRNEEYLQQMENKSKWIVPNDFDRYKQPSKEKYYFPKINKEL